MAVQNEQVNAHLFLRGMYSDGYFPDYLRLPLHRLGIRLRRRGRRDAGR